MDVIVGLDVLFIWRNIQVENAHPICGMIPALYRSDRGEISAFTETKLGLPSSGK